ncbi:MAG: hypothetical protein Q4A00_02605 [Flavobacteriaceae bacterium]|nr:hypothetical protein [Flavobacteriaceae bacterium]
MKIKNIKDFEKRKSQLKAEISEIESVLTFQNPRKTFGVMTNGLTEKYLGGVLNNKATQNVLPLAGRFLENSLKLGTANVLKNIVKRRLTRTVVAKGLLGVGAVVATYLLVKKGKKALDEYQQRETTKSLSQLI